MQINMHNLHNMQTAHLNTKYTKTYAEKYAEKHAKICRICFKNSKYVN